MPHSLLSPADPAEAPPGDLPDAAALARRRLCLRLVLCCVAVGAGLRIVQYLYNPSYWNDEAAIVLNVMQRDYAGLLKPLDFAQAAPPLFLWIERAAYQFFGPSEFALRAPPVLLGLLSLPAFAVLAWRVLTPVGAAWAVAWFAINDLVIFHVSEAKQYSDDLFCSVLLWLVAFAPAAATPARRLARAAAVACVAFWLSFPAVMVFGGITLALALRILRRPRGWLVLIACLVPPLVSCAALAKVVLAAPHDPYLDWFWRASFADRSFKFPLWLARVIFELADYPYGSVGAVLLILTSIGIWQLRSRKAQPVVAAFLLTIAVAIVASAVRIYPFGGVRVSLYLIPPLFLLMGAGADAFTIFTTAGAASAAAAVTNAFARHPSPIWKRLRLLAVVSLYLAPIGLLGLAIVQCARHAVLPEFRSTIRPVVAFVREHRRPGEAIFLAGGGQMPQPRISGRNVEFLCYWREGEQGISRRMIPPEAITAARFWVVYSTVSTEKMVQLNALLKQLDAVADRQQQFTAGAAGAVLFQRRPPAAPPP